MVSRQSRIQLLLGISDEAKGQLSFQGLGLSKSVGVSFCFEKDFIARIHHDLVLRRSIWNAGSI